MDIAIVPFGEIEADVDMFSRIFVSVFVPGQAADNVAALLYRLIEQFGGAGIAHDSFLRKGDHLDVAIPPVIFARQEEPLRAAQAADGSNIGEQPEEGRAVPDPGLEHAP